uniref:(northern house mosquito) hypothetical protein n=1 Tax=Culex pipiens TaxID=7175 RepID=A0A8D8C793_CULPI
MDDLRIHGTGFRIPDRLAVKDALHHPKGDRSSPGQAQPSRTNHFTESALQVSTHHRDGVIARSAAHCGGSYQRTPLEGSARDRRTTTTTLGYYYTITGCKTAGELASDDFSSIINSFPS